MPSGASERYAFEQVDICDRATLDSLFAQYQPDIVMHLAAESHVGLRSIDGLRRLLKLILLVLYTLLEAARHFLVEIIT